MANAAEQLYTKIDKSNESQKSDQDIVSAEVKQFLEGSTNRKELRNTLPKLQDDLTADQQNNLLHAAIFAIQDCDNFAENDWSDKISRAKIDKVKAGALCIIHALLSTSTTKQG